MSRAQGQAALQALLAQAGAHGGDLASLIQGRLGELIGDSSGYIESLPVEVQRRVKALRKLHDDHLEIESEFQEAVIDLERKFAAKYAPIYAKREQVISGAHEPTDEECVYDGAEEEDVAKLRITEVQDDGETPVESGEKVVGIPEFWLTALKNQGFISDLIFEYDDPILQHLTNIALEPLTENPGFKIIFSFSENEYFVEKELVKTYLVKIEKGGKLVYDKSIGCTITWKSPEKNVTVKSVKKTQKHKGKGTTRTITKQVPQESFFNVFSPPVIPDDAEEEDVTDEDSDRLGRDYQLGELLKERVIPHAILWFTGEGDDEDEDDYGEDEGYDDDEDEDEDDSRAIGYGGHGHSHAGGHGHSHGRGGHGHSHGGDDDDEDDADYKPPAGDQKAPECKQQ